MIANTILCFDKLSKAKLWAQYNNKLRVWIIEDKEAIRYIVTSIEKFSKTYLEQPRHRGKLIYELFNKNLPTKFFFVLDFPKMSSKKIEKNVRDVVNDIIGIFNLDCKNCVSQEDVIIRQSIDDVGCTFLIIFKDIIFQSGIY